MIMRICDQLLIKKGSKILVTLTHEIPVICVPQDSV